MSFFDSAFYHTGKTLTNIIKNSVIFREEALTCSGTAGQKRRVKFDAAPRNLSIERKHEEDFRRHAHVVDFGGVMKKYYPPNNSSAGRGREE